MGRFNWSTTYKAIQAAVACALTDTSGNSLPAYLEGTSGSGKTEAAKSLAKSFGKYFESKAATQCSPEIFAGFPYPDQIAGVMRYLPDSAAERIDEAGEGGSVVLLDELADAPRTVQAALHGPWLEGQWGDKKLPRHARIACSNPPHISTTGGSLSRPMAKRCIHFEYAPDGVWWAEREEMGWPVEEPLVPLGSEWNSNQAKWRVLLGAFMRRFPDYFDADDRNFPSEIRAGIKDSDASPCARTWSAVRVFAAYADYYDLGANVLAVLVEGCVGHASAQKFLTYVRELDLPDPEQVLSDPMGVTLPNRGDQIFAVVRSVVVAVVERNTVERYEAAWQFAVRLKDEGHGGAAALAVPELARNQPKGLGRLPKVAAEFLPLLKEAGLV